MAVREFLGGRHQTIKDPDQVRRETVAAEQTFFRWKRRCAGLAVSAIRRLRQLEKENRRPKQLVAGLTPWTTTCSLHGDGCGFYGSESA